MRGNPFPLSFAARQTYRVAVGHISNCEAIYRVTTVTYRATALAVAFLYIVRSTPKFSILNFQLSTNKKDSRRSLFC